MRKRMTMTNGKLEASYTMLKTERKRGVCRKPPYFTVFYTFLQIFTSKKMFRSLQIVLAGQVVHASWPDFYRRHEPKRAGGLNQSCLKPHFSKQSRLPTASRRQPKLGLPCRQSCLRYLRVPAFINSNWNYSWNCAFRPKSPKQKNITRKSNQMQLPPCPGLPKLCA